jgi:hypothetical protein
MIFGVIGMLSSYGCSVYLVICCMGANEADKNDPCVVVDPRDEAVVIPCDVENDPVPGKEIGRRETG